MKMSNKINQRLNSIEREVKTTKDHFKRQDEVEKSERKDRARRAANTRNRSTINHTMHQSALLPKAVEDYTASLSHPRAPIGARVPYNVNNILTENSTLATTTLYIPALQVAANTCYQLTSFGGHGEYEAMHPKSFQSGVIDVAGATHAIPGPMDISTNVAANVFGKSALAFGAADTTTTGWTHYIYDTALPYAGSTGDGSTCRWRLVSMGVRITNFTSRMSMGGSCVTVQPPTRYANTSQAGYLAFPSFAVHGVDTRQNCGCGDGEGYVHGEDHSDECNAGSDEKSGWVTWKPRAQDISFWHMAATSGVSTTAADDVALWVWLNGDSVNAQNYNIEYVFNWEIAGTSFRSISKPTEHSVIADSVMPVANAAMHATSSAGASLAPEMSRIATASSDSGYNKILHGALNLLEPVGAFAVGALTDTLPAVIAEEAGRFFGSSVASIPGRNKRITFGRT